MLNADDRRAPSIEMGAEAAAVFEALNTASAPPWLWRPRCPLLKKVPEFAHHALHKGELSDPTGALRYPPRPGGSGPA